MDTGQGGIFDYLHLSIINVGENNGHIFGE